MRSGDGAEAPRLFPAEQLRLRPSGEARFRPLAQAKQARRLTPHGRKEEEDGAAMAALRRHGQALAAHFGLRYASLEAEDDGVTEHYGICYRDGVIRIRLRHATTGKLLKDSSLVDTLCHELAHLRHFDHGKRFRRFYETILEEARERGIYRPGPLRMRPLQGTLFDGVGCGTGTARRRRA